MTIRREPLERTASLGSIGRGSLGGKAEGLALAVTRVLSGLEPDQFKGVEIAVPRLCVVTTEIFDAFLAANDLHDLALSETPDDLIAREFQRGQILPEHRQALSELVMELRTPLAVRSSSLFEDSLGHPFAGVYVTKMIPNVGPDESRLTCLEDALKLIWASTFFRRAKMYAAGLGHSLQDEKMAVLLQTVAGRRRGDRFYPCISGVARSHNYYPSGRARPEEGVIDVALGLGKTIVEGGLSWTYSPAHPGVSPPVAGVRDLLRRTQNRFWCIRMIPPELSDPTRDTEFLGHEELAAAERDGVLGAVASTYDPQEDRLRPGLVGKGPRVVDFAPLLRHGKAPFNDVVSSLLQRSREALGGAVEIEFAFTCDEAPARFAILQVRPMASASGRVAVARKELEAEDVVLASESVLGNGDRTDIRDVVFLDPEVFEARHTPAIARELEDLNQALVSSNRPYLLVGFGRWGSSERWLGVPVEWGQVSGARVIVEATLPGMTPDLSQGSHFFHNLIGLEVLYLSVPHDGPFSIDWNWLRRQREIRRKRFVRHVRTARPLKVRVDCVGGRGLVRRG